ncbi:hypothetical protein MKS88_002589 [Plasmodium brasilianum]|uniref:Uncharacterized protein n=1 Tax=Plasmodium brasilianum TaxID=5824 RepID=A0ACB9YBC3_PLABR|nr:hypothetical protein MKS88_002589 [Plasmodium brasilianum]
MEKCFSSHLNIGGTGFFRFVRDQDFKNITKNIIEKTSSLNKENNKEEFRKKCLDLANYVIHNKIAPSYHNQVIWERAIKGWAESHYEKLNKYGGCPLILEEKDKKILELKYEEVDLCDKIKKYLDEIQRLKGKLPSESEKEEIGSQTKDKEKKGESSVSHDSPEQAEPTEGVATNQINQYTKHNQHEEKNKEESESPSKPDVQTQAHVSSLEFPSNEVEAKSEGSLESQTPTLLSNSQPSPEVSGESGALASVPPDTKAQKPSESTLSSPIKKYSSSSFASTIPSATSVHINRTVKKKKKIKRRQAKFRKILIPSHSDRKKEFLTHNHLEHPCYDDEEITKKIKILEDNMIKNLHESKQKKKRSKTIIEVHMEVLQEWKMKNGITKKENF